MLWTYPYPREHLLYRRSKIELHNPDYKVYDSWCSCKGTDIQSSARNGEEWQHAASMVLVCVRVSV